MQPIPGWPTLWPSSDGTTGRLFHAGSVKLHPVSSLAPGWRAPPASEEARMNDVLRGDT
jgi:hypothetical protein